MIVSEIEIQYKRKAVKMQTVRAVGDAYKVLKSVYDYNKIDHKEFTYCLYLNRSKKVLAVMLISEGGTAGCVCDLKLIFQGALKVNAHSFILSHNHPSGSVKPSTQDIKLTDQIKQAGNIMDIDLVDHIIISRRGYYSFAKRGLI